MYLDTSVSSKGISAAVRNYLITSKYIQYHSWVNVRKSILQNKGWGSVKF